MRVLLDTNALLWAALRPERLPAAVAALIADEQNIVLISSASAWEIGTKVRLGKLPGAEDLERNFPELVAAAGYAALPIDVATALRAARLPGFHRDPFDRMIAAHALEHDVPVVSADAQLDGFGVRRIW